MAQPGTAGDEPPGQTVESHDEADDDEVGGAERHVGDTEEAVTERVHHVDDGVHLGDALPEGRQQGDGVEDSAQIGERRQHEGGDDADVVEGLGKHGVDEPAEGKQDRGQQYRDADAEQVMDLQRHEEQRHQGDDEADTEAARHATAHIAGDDDVVGHGGHQQLLHVALELGAEEGGGDVGVGVGDDRHHDEAGHDELHVAEAPHVTDARSDEVAEDDEVEAHGDGGRHQGLDPDPGEAADLLGQNALEGDVIGGQIHAFLPSSTRLTNSSSSRLALLRMLSTCTCWPESCSNRLLRDWLLSRSTSRVRSSCIRPLNSGRFGTAEPGARSSMKVSRPSLASSFFMLVCSMRRPLSMMPMLRHSISASSR